MCVSVRLCGCAYVRAGMRAASKPGPERGWAGRTEWAHVGAERAGARGEGTHRTRGGDGWVIVLRAFPLKRCLPREAPGERVLQGLLSGGKRGQVAEETYVAVRRVEALGVGQSLPDPRQGGEIGGVRRVGRPPARAVEVPNDGRGAGRPGLAVEVEGAAVAVKVVEDVGRD
eukprot:363953-Chlamydomonas_euryale.AAC.16